MKKYIWLLFVPTIVIAGGTIQIFQNASSPAGTIVITQGTAGQTLGQVIISSAVANGSAYTYIQNKSAAAVAASVTAAFTSPVTAHSLIVVQCIQNVGTNSILVSDNNSNVYSTATISNQSTGNRVGIYYALNANAGATTVTCKDNLNAAGWVQTSIVEYGSNGTGSFDVASSSEALQSIANPTSTPITTTVNNEFVVALYSFTGANATGQSGTLRFTYVNEIFSGGEDTVVLNAGSYTSTFVATASNWVMQQAAFK